MASFILSLGQGSAPVTLVSAQSNPTNESGFAQALVNAMSRVAKPTTAAALVFTFDDAAHTLTVSGLN